MKSLLLVTFLALAPPASAFAAEPIPIIGGFALARPVTAHHGMVVSQEPQASRVGLEILKRGGNAIDAAVAVGFALAVTHPQAGNIGGGGFMVLHRADTKTTTAIDYRETAPALTTKDVFLNPDGQVNPFKSRFSGLAVGVPGTVAGFELAWRKYGSGKLTFAELVEPAVKLARQGLTVEGDFADTIPIAQPMLALHPSSARIYLRPDLSPPQRGDHIALDDLATTLERIRDFGPDGFYKGPVAEKIVAAVNDLGGRMTLDDLANYKAIEREPVRGTYRGHEIVSMPPPSSGGVHVIEILNILEGFPIAEQGLNSAATIHEMSEAEKLAYADRAKYLGDPDFVHVPVKGLTSKAYAATLRATIQPDRARPPSEIMPGDPLPYESDQTNHFSVVDGDGDAVSNTYTLNYFYGCGVVAEGTGVLLNNELDDFAAKAGAPNSFGLLGGDANAPGANRRPLSSISPTLVFKDGQIELVTGSIGGSRILTMVVQIILDIVDHGLNIAEAVGAPRTHDQGFPEELRVERGLSPDTVRLLQAMGHKVVVREATGSTGSIVRASDGTLMGAADPRQGNGLAIGY